MAKGIDLFGDDNTDVGPGKNDVSIGTDFDFDGQAEFAEAGKDDGGDMNMGKSTQKNTDIPDVNIGGFLGLDDDGVENEEDINAFTKEDFPSSYTSNFKPEKDDNDEPGAQSGQDGDDEDDEDEDLDLDKMNKTLGTDYKSVKELKEAFKEPEKPIITDEEKVTYEKNEMAIQFLEKAKSMSRTNLIKENLISEYMQENNNEKPDQEALEEIEFKIQRMVENGTDFVVAENIKNRIEKAIQERKSFNDTIDSRKKEKEQQTLQKNQLALKESLTSIFNQGDFYGVKVSPEIIKEAYQDVLSGEFHKSVENDTQLTAELAVMRRLRNEIRSRASKPTQSDSIKDVFSQIGIDPNSKVNRQRASQASANGQGGRVTKGKDPLVDAWVS